MSVDQNLVSSIGRGVLIFAAVAPSDTKKQIESMANKVLKMKMWPDESGSNVLYSCVGGEGAANA